MVIDAIDAMGPKTELIAETQKRGIGLISCMGAALRTDPAAIRVGPFSEVRGCPLAARIRYWLRKKNYPAQFICAYSTEPLGRLRLGARQAAGTEKDYYDRGRQRAALGSLPTVTGIFGLTIANTVIQTLLSGRLKAEG
jgi:tRNA A37 threonylcarbamoyladenosine dehydratase